jgi:hypothetical protein
MQLLIWLNICSQKAAITELEKQLVEERSQWRDEKEKAESLLKAAVERVLAESFEELKQQSEAAAWQQKEQLVVINKLQVHPYFLFSFIKKMTKKSQCT